MKQKNVRFSAAVVVRRMGPRLLSVSGFCPIGPSGFSPFLRLRRRLLLVGSLETDRAHVGAALDDIIMDV